MKVINLKSNSLYIGLCLIILIFYSFLYANYIQKDPILGRDDIILIFPLETVTTFSRYVEAVKRNDIPDFQPVRDLTFFTNIKIIEWTGISTFHLTNFILFILIVFLLMKLLEALAFTKRQIVCSALLFVAHPIMVSAVGWISARKHSLALAFLLLTLLCFLKEKRITPASIIFYFLSVLSHQIFILLPCWILLFSLVKKIKLEIGRFVVMSLIGVTVLFVAVLKTFYLEMGNVTYKSFHWSENVSRYVLSVGRSVTQIVFPVSISGDYYQGNMLNLVGLPLLIIGLYLIYKGKDREDSLLWIGLAMFSHILTCIAFINDTYLYLPLICVIISANYYLKSNPLPVSSKFKAVLFALCFALFMTKTLSASQMWKSDKDLWQYSYANEASPYTSILLGRHLLKHDEKIALDFIVWGVNNYDILNNRNIYIFFLETIYTSSLPIQKKIKIYNDCYKDHEVYKAFHALALIEGTDEQMQDGIRRMKPLMKIIDLKKHNQSSGMTIIKSLKSLCLKFKEKSVACKELGVVI
jgi:hypothetical protein